MFTDHAVIVPKLILYPTAESGPETSPRKDHSIQQVYFVKHSPLRPPVWGVSNLTVHVKRLISRGCSVSPPIVHRGCFTKTPLGTTLNSAYNEVTFNEKSPITKENFSTKYTPFTYKYITLNEKPHIMKQNLHIFFLLQAELSVLVE